MRINFRQGIVSYQTGGFLSLNGTGNVDLSASTKPVTVTIAQDTRNYLFSEDLSVTNAWVGPFSSSEKYWLYWEFNPLTFVRSFNSTTLEPVAQSIEPGSGNVTIISAVIGSPGIGSFTVNTHYELTTGRQFVVTGSTANDGTYTVASTSYNTSTGETTITVNEAVISAVGDGEASLDVDSNGIALKTTGRIWFNTTTNRQYIRQPNAWQEILLVFAGIVVGGNTFVSPSISSGSSFAGTQVGNVNSVFAGRILFDESGTPIQRADNTFFTSEDQFLVGSAKADSIRIESNVHRAQFTGSSAIAKFSPVSFITNGKIQEAVYNDTGSTVIGITLEDLTVNEVGSIILQGIVTNPAWSWTNIGVPLWVNNGTLVETDPHVSDAITYPIGQVPVARVLSSDTVVFEQGLGGKGDRGPAGTTIDTLPVASTSNLGAVTLLTASSNPTIAYVISDTDSRLTDARTPTSHSHPASEIIVTPFTGISATDAQAAFVEMYTKKVNVSGDTMTGLLTLSGDPTAALHAATKQYVDTTSVSISGDTMTGLLTLSGDPTSALHAATKQYVDNTAVSITGDTMTGYLSLSGDPTSALHAATKQYVDAFPYDITAQGLGVLSNATVIKYFVAPRIFTISTTGHQGYALTAPSVTAATFTVYHTVPSGSPLSYTPVSIGTITFNAGSRSISATNFTTPVTINVGDIVTIECTTASSIADASITLFATGG